LAVVDDNDDMDDIEEGSDEILEGAFPDRKGNVDVVSWRVTEEIEYRLIFGRLFPWWGIASWGLVTLSRGAEVAEATYDDRPREFTREGLTVWLVDSGVDAGAAVQLAGLAVEARGDLFPGEPPGEDEPGSASIGSSSARRELADEETPIAERHPGGWEAAGSAGDSVRGSR
jgi:hypothetical protein